MQDGRTFKKKTCRRKISIEKKKKTMYAVIKPDHELKYNNDEINKDHKEFNVELHNPIQVFSSRMKLCQRKSGSKERRN